MTDDENRSGDGSGNHGVGSGDHFKIIEYLCKRNMTKEDKDILLRLLQQHKELGISEQIDNQKFYLDSLISNSVALSDMEPEPIAPEMVDKWSIKPLADKDEFTTEQIVSHFGFNTTTAKRYLRQLTEFDYLEPHGGNKNRTYGNKK